MSYTLREVNTVIETLWPLANAEEWDSPGVVSGAAGSEISTIHLAVDAVAATVEEACSAGADLLLVHHPLLLRGIRSIAEDHYKGALLAALVRSGCALVVAHTNADVVENGVSAVLADRLGLLNHRPLIAHTSPEIGTGRVGDLARPLSLGRLAQLLAQILPATASGIRVSGEYDSLVSRVSLCAGAGDSLLAEPSVCESDVFITSDLRHHPASEAREQALISSGPALIDVSHWASEWLWLERAATQLRHALPGVRVEMSDLRTDPWDFVVTQ